MSPLSRLVVLAPNWLGDAVMAIPSVAALRAAYPEGSLTVAARAHLAPLFEMVDGVDQVVAFERVGRTRRWGGAVADARCLRDGGFDVAVLLPNSFRSALTARLAGIRERWGYSTDRRAWLLTRAIPMRRFAVTADYADSHRVSITADYAHFHRLDTGPETWGGHQVEYYLRLVERLLSTDSPTVRESDRPNADERGLAGSSSRPTESSDTAGEMGKACEAGNRTGPTRPLLTVPAAARDGARGLLAAHGWRPGDRLVGMAPGAAYGTAKQWLPERFAQLAVQLRAAGVRPVLVGTAADRPVCEQIRAAAGPAAIDLAGSTDLRELAAVVAECGSFVTNDSGAMHVAVAVGVPVTAIFGPTRELETGPNWGGAIGAHAVMIGHVPCRPCMLRECPTQHECMAAVAVDEVKAAVMRQLEAR